MLKNLFLYTSLFWTGVILFFCLKKASDLPQIDFPYLDKLVHVFFHFILTLLWFLFFKKKINNEDYRRPLLFSFVFSLVLGVIIEFIQYYCTATRSGDVLDVLANLFGTFLTVALVVVLKKRTTILDKI